jgi:hypothetical protein
VDDAIVDVVATECRNNEGRKVKDEVADVIHGQALKQPREILKEIS